MGSDESAGGGKMAALVAAFDWSTTPLGPLSEWPAAWRAALQGCLDSGFAVFLWCGPELIQVYNDAACSILKGKHPTALGAPAREAWAEVWPTVGPLAQSVLDAGAPLRGEDLPLVTKRDGAPETAYFTFSCGPLRDDDGAISGVRILAIETTAKVEAERQLRRGEERLRLAVDVARLGTWDWDIASGEVTWSDEHFRMIGYQPGDATPSYEAFAERVHPADLPGVVSALTAARYGRVPYVHEFRSLHPDGSTRWCSARGRFYYDERGEAVRMIGVMRDATAERTAAAQQQLLMAEVQHRTRNLIGLIKSVASRTAETSDSLDGYTPAFQARLDAIARTEAALTRRRGSAVDLGGLILDEFLAAAGSEQVTLDGPEVALDGKLAQSMSLAVHELVTNALKYGALANRQGRVEVRWWTEGEDDDRWLSLRWQETGVPILDTSPRRFGFGRRLLERALPYELGAETRLEFAPGGLKLSIRAPLGNP